jgi:hypothetical protein
MIENGNSKRRPIQKWNGLGEWYPTKKAGLHIKNRTRYSISTWLWEVCDVTRWISYEGPDPQQAKIRLGIRYKYE